MTRAVIVALRRLAQLVSAIADIARIILLLPFLVIGLVISPEMFKREYYRNGRHAGPIRRLIPLSQFLLRGAWTLQSPNPDFSQDDFASRLPRLRLRPPVLNELLNPDYVLRPRIEPAAQVEPLPTADPLPLVVDTPTAHPVLETPEPTRFDEIWELVKADAKAFEREVSSITPTDHLKTMLGTRVQSPLAANDEARAIRSILARIPGNIQFMLILPWLGIKGGAERRTERFLAFLRMYYNEDEVCVFVPDEAHRHSVGGQSRYGFPIVAINDVLPHADLETRIRILDRVITNVQAQTVHNADSYVAWNALTRHGRYLAKSSKIFVNLFSDIRIKGGMPVGYFHNMLPTSISFLHGVICDNQNVITRAKVDLGFSDRDISKFHNVPTPIVGLNGGDPRLDLRAPELSAAARSLWMSRIAIEKRIDVLNAIARALPQRDIEVYGATLSMSEKVDPALLDLPNIRNQGEFETLRTIPVERYDSYIFTSDNEGMPTTVLEATMLGLPVIAPKVGGIAELIDHDTGWLVDYPDSVDAYVAALGEIRSDPEQAIIRVQRAQQRLIKRYSFDRFIKNLVALPGYVDGSKA